MSFKNIFKKNVKLHVLNAHYKMRFTLPNQICTVYFFFAGCNVQKLSSQDGLSLGQAFLNLTNLASNMACFRLLAQALQLQVPIGFVDWLCCKQTTLVGDSFFHGSSSPRLKHGWARLQLRIAFGKELLALTKLKVKHNLANKMMRTPNIKS